MKQLGFVKELIPLVLSGKKNITWRRGDDEKNLSSGDIIECVETKSRKPFCRIRLISIRDTTFGNIAEDDKKGHETFSSEKEMYNTYSRYFEQKVTEDTAVKVIKFELI